VLVDPERRRGHDLELSRRNRAPRRRPAQLAKIFLQRGIKATKTKLLERGDSFDRATQADPGKPSLAHLALACSQHITGSTAR